MHDFNLLFFIKLQIDVLAILREKKKNCKIWPSKVYSNLSLKQCSVWNAKFVEQSRKKNNFFFAAALMFYVTVG